MEACGVGCMEAHSRTRNGLLHCIVENNQYQITPSCRVKKSDTDKWISAHICICIKPKYTCVYVQCISIYKQAESEHPELSGSQEKERI